MTIEGLRSHFIWKSVEQPSMLRSKLSSCIDGHESLVMSGIDTHLTITVKNELQKIWSPYCHLNFEEDEDGNLEIRGNYGPNPNIWTVFIFLYSLLGLLTFFIFIIGTTQYSLGMDAGILLILPILILLIILLYLAAQVGKRFAKDQTLQIHRFLKECFEKEVQNPGG
ncbi:MAG TPA: hypothetical protein PKC30_11475 [Saprospiraceae bacterium]|nr:hypothetical protein [Saprospiraceae bacterium]